MAKKKASHGGARRGSGRPIANPEGKAIPVTASVPKRLMERLDGIAKAEGWGRSRSITEAIRSFVKRKRR